MTWYGICPPPLSSRLESSSHNLQFTILFFMWCHQMTFITLIQLSNKHIQLMTRDAISFQWPSFLWCTTIVMWAVGHHWGGLVIHHLKKTMSFCYIVNWRISKLFLPDNLYSGAKHIFLSSQKPSRFHWHPFHSDQTNTIYWTCVSKSLKKILQPQLPYLCQVLD